MQAIQHSPTEAPTAPITTCKPPRGLSARWEIVDGKLTCQWFKNPD